MLHNNMNSTSSRCFYFCFKKCNQSSERCTHLIGNTGVSQSQSPVAWMHTSCDHYQPPCDRKLYDQLEKTI